MDDRPDAPSKAAVPVDEETAIRLNNPRDCKGVFRTVNDFGTGPRRKEYLRRIVAWAVDIDDGTKDEQRARLLSSPLVPSEIVETKRGYQAYWNARDGQPEHWNAIVLERLVPFFGADRNARDLCRILRCPGFLHLKDPADPFMVQTVHEWQVSYTERQIGEAFRWVCSTPHHIAEQRAEVRASVPGAEPSGDEFWQAVANLDCRDALERFSGSPLCRSERFTFRRVSSGNWNILIDGKGCSCWIDTSGKIGSSDKGGPFITNWLRWYGNDWRTVIEAVKAAYPHLAEIDERCKARWRDHQRATRRAA